MQTSQVRFIHQQGFSRRIPTPDFYQALMFQPRVITGLFTIGVLLPSPWYFVSLAGVLAWNALLPDLNVFDALYNRRAIRPADVRLTAAPAPRRFAQGVASTLSLVIAIALLVDTIRIAWGIEILFAAALVALVFGRFCVGSAIYYLIFGREPRVVQLVPRPVRLHDAGRGAR
jgi:hypothetical protein